MEFYKKFKASKTSNTENSADIIDETEKKYADMQPVIRNSSGDELTVQRKIWDIRTDIKTLQSLEGTASTLQRERIKEITQKMKDILITHSNVTGETSAGKSKETEQPEPVKPSQNKVSLNEVEEKLKSMRQKRLNRLSVFVTEQSKLSEERGKKNSESSEIEEAIKSIQHKDEEKKVNFKSIIEESFNQPKETSEVKKEAEDIHTPIFNRNRKNEAIEKTKNKVTTKKFINRFNCTTTNSIYSSNEDIFKEAADTRFSQPQRTKSETDSISEKEINPNRKSNENTKEIKMTIKIPQHNLDNYNPLLSPVGKQRKAIYLYENECDFLQKEKQTSLPLMAGIRKDGSLKRSQETNSKVVHLYENRDIIAKNDIEKNQLVLTTFKKNTVQEQVTEKSSVDTPQVSKSISLPNKPENSSFTRKVEDKKMPSSKIERRDRIYSVYENRKIIDNRSDVVKLPKSNLQEEKVAHKSEDVDEYKNNISTEKPKEPIRFGKSNSQEFTKNEITLTPGYTLENNVIKIANPESKLKNPPLKTFRSNSEDKIGNTVRPEQRKGNFTQLYENVNISHNKVFKTPSIGESQIDDKENKQKISTSEINQQVHDTEKHEHIDKSTKNDKLRNMFINNDMRPHAKANDNNYEDKNSSRNPRHSPRKNNTEKVLKKFQRNWDSLNEIIDNDSDVDYDEIEDFKKTLDDAKILFDQYQANIKSLNLKSSDNNYSHKLTDIKQQLDDVENDIINFRGLRRDLSYKQLSNKLSNYILETNNIKCSKTEMLNERQELLNEIERCVQILESRAARNETFLLEILETQVKSIGTNIFNITTA